MASIVVSVKNTRGVWKLLENKEKTRIFNFEMREDTRSGFDWIRVSEMDPKTLFKVIAWGEGFYSPMKQPQNSDSSFVEKVQIRTTSMTR